MTRLMFDGDFCLDDWINVCWDVFLDDRIDIWGICLVDDSSPVTESNTCAGEGVEVLSSMEDELNECGLSPIASE
jgi:hypothetical protein